MISSSSKPLIDTFGREHTYLRISLTERCNLRCFYCMPEEGVQIKENEKYMSRKEIFQFAKYFVDRGVTKIRLTGGEPLVRKDVRGILRDLSSLPVELGITSNGVIIDKFIPLFQEIGLHKINISLDSLDAEKNLFITKRDYFDRIMSNIRLLCDEGFRPKINAVVMRGVNSDEVIEFIELTHQMDIDVRFIEFMPFSGNSWSEDKCMSFDEIIGIAETHFGSSQLTKLSDGHNFISRGYKVKGYKGQFGVISTVTKPFCSECNRIRLTADGKLKNCLFSAQETDLLSHIRSNRDIDSIVDGCIRAKKESRGGLGEMTDKTIEMAEKNRSMILIGG